MRYASVQNSDCFSISEVTYELHRCDAYGLEEQSDLYNISFTPNAVEQETHAWFQLFNY